MQVKEQQLELDMEHWTGSKLGKEYIKAVYCHPAYLTFIQSTSREMLGWDEGKPNSINNKNELGWIFFFHRASRWVTIAVTLILALGYSGQRTQVYCAQTSNLKKFELMNDCDLKLLSL